MIRSCTHCGQRNRVPAAHLADRGICGACRQPLEPLAEPLDVDATSFDEIVTQARVPVLVDFWAEWCSPCKAAAPEVAQAAAGLRGRALVLKVNTESHSALASRYGVRSIPNFVVFKNGGQIAQHAGLMRHAQLEAWVAQAGAPEK